MLPGWEGRLTAIKGNATDRTIRWKGKRIGRLHNKSIQLVFTYTGTLYSYAVR